MKYEQFIKKVEEGDLVEVNGYHTFIVDFKDDIYVDDRHNSSYGYKEITGLYKKDSKGNYMKVEVER